MPVMYSQVSFSNAYQNKAFLTPGILEAISWTKTRMTVLDQNLESCSGLPKAYGIMGLHEDGKNYFKENGKLVAAISGISITQQQADPSSSIEAYALAYNVLMSQRVPSPSQAMDPVHIRKVLLQLSEIPDSGMVNLLARDMQVYEVLRFLNNPQFAQTYGFPVQHYDLSSVFGSSNYSVLSASKITITEGMASSGNIQYVSPEAKSSDYPPAIWNPAASCNYSSRSGVAVSAITIHTVQGTYAGAISWAQNCSSSVSFHYVIRSSDGQVTQMVLESDKAWHVGSENPYTIGYEHEGYVDNAAWYTEAMYQSSANLSKDVVNSGYGIPGLRTYDGASSSVVQVLGSCTKIKGHQHYPNQTHTDPGINWNWEKYYRLINDNPTITTISSSTGDFYDSGGAGNAYQDDERLLWLFQPPNALNVTLNFSSFTIESGYDNLFIYDGSDLNAPLIGSYTGTNSPGIVTSSGPTLLVEFRSDCGTVDSGWAAQISSQSADTNPPTTAIFTGSNWITSDFTANFTDTDSESGVAESYYLLAEKDPLQLDFHADPNLGFAYETFAETPAVWVSQTGTFQHTGSAMEQTDELEQNSNFYYTINQDNQSAFLYEWEQYIGGSGTNKRGGLHFFADDPTLTNRGNSYFVFLREDDNRAQIYKVENDVFTLVSDNPFDVLPNTNYSCKATFNPQDGWIHFFVANQLAASWQDPSPHLSGNAISFRSGGCSFQFDGVSVFRSRGSNVTISVGPGMQMSFQSISANPSGLIQSLVKDNTDNWSSKSTELLLIDWSAAEVNYLNDGPGSDIDTLTTSNLEGNWLTEDIHSGILQYDFAVGTLPAMDNVIPWTSIGSATNLSESIPSPVYNQTYYLAIKVSNQAGLSVIYLSDGLRYIPDAKLGEINESLVYCYPNPASTFLHIGGMSDEFSYEILDHSGRICLHGQSYKSVDVSPLAEGVYMLKLSYENKQLLHKFVIKR